VPFGDYMIDNRQRLLRQTHDPLENTDRSQTAYERIRVVNFASGGLLQVLPEMIELRFLECRGKCGATPLFFSELRWHL
jgi:hypothetical protein